MNMDEKFEIIDNMFTWEIEEVGHFTIALQNVRGLFVSVEFWNYVRMINTKYFYIKEYLRWMSCSFMKNCWKN